jgi:hypothetical protein
LVDTVRGVTGTTICRLHFRRPKKRIVVGAAIDLAAAVAATGSGDWQAIVATRGASRTTKPECHLLRVVGDVSAATALLEVAAELRVAALRGAVPIFEAASELLHRTGVLDEDVLFGSEYDGGDMADLDTRFVWGAVTMAEILDLQPSVAELAAMVWGSVDAFVSIDKLDPAPARRAGTR